MKEWFYTITETMVKELGLTGTDLLLFAVLYGYSQRADGCYWGTRAALAERCGVASRRTIDTALENLIKKGLIKKDIIKKEGTEIVAYSVCVKLAQGVQKLHTPPVQNLLMGGAKIAHIDNKGKKKVSDISTPLPPATSPTDIAISPTSVETDLRSNPPTLTQVADYARSRGFTDPEGFASYFLEICNNNGWKMANGKGKPVENWKNYIVTSWEKYHKTKTFPRTAPAIHSLHQTTDNDFNKYLR